MYARHGFDVGFSGVGLFFFSFADEPLEKENAAMSLED